MEQAIPTCSLNVMIKNNMLLQSLCFSSSNAFSLVSFLASLKPSLHYTPNSLGDIQIWDILGPVCM
ncbi:hypothetical protein M9Y10_017098 [Tritrichomonas musculus]|uniref:Uncharacterized protein n=1 Tax=Tritrichomonas musculus TaxID=1915356 RepID=A0ABR2HV59_9EUKA